MLSNIHAPLREHNAVADDDLIIVVPYVDTIGLFFVRHPPVGARKLIEPLTRRRTIIDTAYARHHGVVGYRLTVHQPSPTVLLLLNHLQVGHRYGAPICRVDIAVDWCFREQPLAKLMHDWAHDHLRLRWRPRGRMFRAINEHDDSHTDYAVCQRDRIADGKRRSPRDRGFYSDQPSKVTGMPCCHAELKFQNARACRAQGWYLPSDLLRLDPDALANKHLRIAAFGRSYPLTVLCIPKKLVWFPSRQP
jgi:hypothetical protein